MKAINYSLALLFSLSLLACGTQESKTEEIEETKDKVTETFPKGDNSQVSLDWNGTYQGTIPCASCSGIETTLTLNEDETFLLMTTYLGRNDDLEQEMSGSFSWDEDGSTITLNGVEGMPGKYKVGENQLWHLDMNGDQITGDLADHYILKKQ